MEKGEVAFPRLGTASGREPGWRRTQRERKRAIWESTAPDALDEPQRSGLTGPPVYIGWNRVLPVYPDGPVR